MLCLVSFVFILFGWLFVSVTCLLFVCLCFSLRYDWLIVVFVIVCILLFTC